MFSGPMEKYIKRGSVDNQKLKCLVLWWQISEHPELDAYFVVLQSESISKNTAKYKMKCSFELGWRH